jgi:flagellar motor switch protein FliM
MTALTPLTAQAFQPAGGKNRNGLAHLPQGCALFARQLGKGLAKFAGAPPIFSYESFAPVAGPAAIGEDQAAFMLDGADASRTARVVMDRALVFGLCDLLLGGVGNEPAYAEERPLSKIELALAALIAAEVGEALPHAFPGAALEPLSLRTQTEDKPTFEAALGIRFLGAMQSSSGEMHLELSPALAGLMKPVASAPDLPQARPRAETIGIDLTAILGGVTMNLEELGRLAPGQLIRLGVTAATPVSVTSGGIELFKAKLGQGERKFCLGLI